MKSGSAAPADRMRRQLKRLVLASGRPVRCEACGVELFRVVPIPWRGGVKLLGAEQALVRVDFDSMNELVFRHVEADSCRRPDGPA
jgi:hypothetical protein